MDKLKKIKEQMKCADSKWKIRKLKKQSRSLQEKAKLIESKCNNSKESLMEKEEKHQQINKISAER